MNDSPPPEQQENNPSIGTTSNTNTASEARQIQVRLSPAAKKDLDSVGRGKPQAQIAAKIADLAVLALPHDARPIKGANFKANGWNFYRVDAGEYRIVYDLNEQTQVLTIVTIAVIAARNDDKVYRLMQRRFG